MDGLHDAEEEKRRKVNSEKESLINVLASEEAIFSDRVQQQQERYIYFGFSGQIVKGFVGPISCRRVY
jgi:hypothetical protein